MTDEILNLMENRRKLKRNSEEYKTVHRMIRTNRKVEDFHGKDLRSMYNKIKEIIGRRKAYSNTGCLKSIDGYIIMEKEEIIERREDYIKDLYEDNKRKENFRIRTNSEEPQILRSEVYCAMNRIKKGKTPGPDIINIELLKNWKS